MHRTTPDLEALNVVKSSKLNKNSRVKSDCFLLTTIDNPFSPFTRFEEWLMFDKLNNYNTCELLARIVHISNALTDNENRRSIEFGMNEIVINDLLGVYCKVKEKDFNENGLRKPQKIEKEANK